ncbi:MAG: 3'-5' exonuclease [Deinococcales bacterium]
MTYDYYYDYYMVIDLEATCANDGSLSKEDMETIEIGAVMVEAKSLKKISEFQAFIKPILHPKLSVFCTLLTSISQQDIDNAASFREVFASFYAWHECYPTALFSSWGDYDRKQFRLDCVRHNISYPFKDHLNLKKQFAEKQGLARACDLASALNYAHLPLLGKHHRGIDDARNMVHLLDFIVGEKKIAARP